MRERFLAEGDDSDAPDGAIVDGYVRCGAWWEPTEDVDLHAYDRIVLNTSGGKDSQATMELVCRMADEVGFPRHRITAFHADLGRMEWSGTRELVEEHCAHYGLALAVERYRDKTGASPTLLDYVRRRGKWPSSTTRYCTSEFKRSPGGRVIAALHRQHGCRREFRVLNVYGFRADESPARAKRDTFEKNERRSTLRRSVFDWLPVHAWSEERVWAAIRKSGVRHHRAYDLGMPRLSCVFCIFAPRAALLIAGRENPELLDEYCLVEEEIGHDFQHKKPIRGIRDALAHGEQPELVQLSGTWNM